MFLHAYGRDTNDRTTTTERLVRTQLLIVRRELGQYVTTWSGYIITAGMLLGARASRITSWPSGPRRATPPTSWTPYFYFASGITLVGGTLSVDAPHRGGAQRKARIPMLATSSLNEGQIIVAKYLAAMVPIIDLSWRLSIYMPHARVRERQGQPRPYLRGLRRPAVDRLGGRVDRVVRLLARSRANSWR